jgi:ABC-type lipoprotein release transport system permease subunit
VRLPPLLLLQLGWRNLWRQRRRNFMLLAAILVAVAGVVLINALIRGLQYEMRDSAVENLSGTLKVLAPGYRDDPSILESFTLRSGWRPDVPKAEMVGWTRRVVVPAVVLSERETRGVNLVGIDPSDERAISFLGDVAISGEQLTNVDDDRILLGAALAEQLSTEVGRRVVVMTQGADGLNREAGFRVAGLYDADGTALEKTYAFTGRAALQRLLGTKAVTEVSIRLKDGANEAAADHAVSRSVGKGLEVLDWRQLDPLAAAMFDYSDVTIFILFIIVMVALAFGLVNTLVTAVMERVREFGMLRAIGMRPGQIIVQVLVESTLVMLIGLGGGILTGMGLVACLADGIDLSKWAQGVEMVGVSSRLTPRLEVHDIVLVTVLSIVLGVLGSGYPAWRAVRINVLDALRRGT